jgi:formate transporter
MQLLRKTTSGRTLLAGGRQSRRCCRTRVTVAAASVPRAPAAANTTTTPAELVEARDQEKQQLQLLLRKQGEQQHHQADAAAQQPTPPPNPIAPPTIFALVRDGGADSLAAPSSLVATWVKALFSGAYIAIGATIACAVVGGLSPALVATHPGLARLIFALVFPVGLLLVMAHGPELFTGQAMRGAVAVLEGKATYGQLLRNWLISFAGNFVGCLCVLALVIASNTPLTIAGSPAASFVAALAASKMALSFSEAVARAVLANWLVCMAVWSAAPTRTASDRFFAVWPPISGFVAAGLEHSVANMMIVPLGLAASGELTLGAFFGRFCWGNLLPVTLGNVIGGAVVVGLGSWVIYGSRGGGDEKNKGEARALS